MKDKGDGVMFGITTAEDMLEKAKLERENYRNDPNSNTIFNLFITIYHIQDYVTNGARRIKKRKANKIIIKKIKEHFGELYVWMKFICNKQKHYVLNRDKIQLFMQQSSHQKYATGLI